MIFEKTTTKFQNSRIIIIENTKLFEFISVRRNSSNNYFIRYIIRIIFYYKNPHNPRDYVPNNCRFNIVLGVYAWM